MMCLKKIFNGEIIFHFIKETEKIALLPVTDLIKIIFKFRTKTISLYVYLSSTKHLFEGHEILYTKYRVAILSKGTN